MINLTNTKDLTLDERKSILQRAVSSQPFFELLDFDILAGTDKHPQYKAKFNVDKDFWITDVKGNFDRVFLDSSAEFWFSAWTAYRGESLSKFIRGEYLPPSFQSYCARFDLQFADQKYSDIQHEILPYHIKRGDSVLASIQPQAVKGEIADCRVVLAGYYALESAYLNERAVQGVNESLKDEPLFELWKIQVTADGISNKQFSNDRFARLILGFGVVDLSTNKADLAASTVIFTDNVRGLKLNNVPIPVEYFAPRLTCERDTHIYYLPTEYLFEPFATMRCEFDTDLNGGLGYELVMLTRTV